MEKVSQVMPSHHQNTTFNGLKVVDVVLGLRQRRSLDVLSGLLRPRFPILSMMSVHGLTLA